MAAGRMMYGVVIHNAIKRGDRANMESVLAEAEEFLVESANVKRALGDLKKSIRRGGPGPITPLYGAVVHDALKRGNLQEMKNLLIEARAEEKRQTELTTAIKDLENALKSK